MAEITLENMQSFDFTAPVNETIIYDDSDEDDKSTIELIDTNENMKDNNCDSKYNFENCCTLGIKREVFDDAAKIEQNYHQQNNTEDIRYKRSDISAELGNIKEGECSPSNKENVYENYIHNKKVGQHKRSSSECKGNEEFKCNKKKNLEHLITQKEDNSQSDKKQGEFCYNENRNCQLPMDCNSNQNIETRQHNLRRDDYHKCNNYVKDIFDTVSQNIIFSILAYKEYVKNIGTTDPTSPMVLNAKKRYMCLKNQYFQWSYTSVVYMILSHEMKDDTKFTDAFLNHTLKYAKEKMYLTLSKQCINTFYHELVAWAKRKNILLDNSCNLKATNEKEELIGNQKEITNSPLLCMQLSKPPILPAYSNYNVNTNQFTQKHNTTMPTKKVPDGGPTVNVDTMSSVLSEYPNKVRPPAYPHYPDIAQPPRLPQHQNLYQIPLSSQYQGLAHPTEFSNGGDWHSTPQYIGKSALPEYSSLSKPPRVDCQEQKTPIFTCGAPNREVVISVDTDTLRMSNYVNSQFLPNNMTANENRFHTQHQDRNFTNTNVGAVSNTDSNRHIENTMYDSGRCPVPTANIYSNSYQYTNQIDSKRNYLDNYYCQRAKTKQPTQPCSPSYYALHSQRQQHNEANNRNYSPAVMPRDQNKQNEQLNQHIENSRSSVSTDSGFASPLPYNTGIDGTTTSSEDGLLAPLITHVTSLNPNATQIIEGACHICNARTKKKCLGCYQMYYCSTPCQMMDWSKHKENCRQVQDLRSMKTVRYFQ